MVRMWFGFFRFGIHLDHHLGSLANTKLIKTVWNDLFCMCSTLQVSPVLLLSILSMGNTSASFKYSFYGKN